MQFVNAGTTPSQKRDTWAYRENCDFIPGHIVENQDCLGKSGTDGHLSWQVIDVLGDQLCRFVFFVVLSSALTCCCLLTHRVCL